MKIPHIFGTFLVVTFCMNAQATLGEHESKISENEAKHFNIKKQAAVTKSDFTVHELNIDGSTVKEFSDSTGFVFAVSWRGMKTPDLSVLFGSYFNEFKAAREKVIPARGRRSVSVKTDALVFEQGGVMRNISGSAYLPKYLPAGVNLRDLQ